MLDDVARGVDELPAFGSPEVAAAVAPMRRLGDLEVGIADASLVVLAERTRCADVLTLDERHLRVLPGPGGRPFRLLPADAA